MRNVLSLVATMSLAACATYKITPIGPSDFSSAVKDAGPEAVITVVEVNESKFPRGFQCFEPMLFFLTLGIIPTHCLSTYQASLESVPTGQTATYDVTVMAGWIALVLAPLPRWQFGSAVDMEKKVEHFVRTTSE